MASEDSLGSGAGNAAPEVTAERVEEENPRCPECGNIAEHERDCPNHPLNADAPPAEGGDPWSTAAPPADES